MRRPDRNLRDARSLDANTATLTRDGRTPLHDAQLQRRKLRRLRAQLRQAHGIPLADWDSADRGVVHVMAPELGLTQPGMVVVCGDSHTATHGAFGALAFGIGTSEVGARARNAVPAAT